MFRMQGLPVVLLCALIVTAPAAGRVAPDPLPDYDSLPVHANLVIHGLADEIGKRIELEDGSGRIIRAHLWDAAYVKLPDGSVATLRYEYQTEEGEHVLFERSLDEFPLGTVEVVDLAEIKPVSLIEYTNENGVLAVIPEEYLYSIGGELTNFGDGISMPTGSDSGCYGVVLLRCAETCEVQGPGGTEPGIATCRMMFGRCRCAVGQRNCSLQRQYSCIQGPECRRSCRGPIPCRCIG